jgi:hypothetical protein
MSPAVPKSSLRNVAVLALSASAAEWLEYDAHGLARHASVPVAGASAGDFARAALEARSAAGGRLHRCRLALGEGLLSHRVLALPTLAKRELRNVLERKAAQAATGEDKSPIFSALDVGPGLEGSRNWLTVTLERELIMALLIRLRGHNFRIRRIVSTTLAGLQRSTEHLQSESQASIAVTVGQDAVEVSLIAGDHLASSDTLAGNLRESPQLVTGLLQLVRTAAAFWRKSQRGAEVASVHILGMPPDRGVFLAQAIGGALPGTQVRCDPSAEDETPGAERVAVLNACLGDGPLALDIQVPLPPRRSLAMLGLAACAGSLLLGFGIVQRAVETPRARILNEIAELEGQAADLAHLQRRQQEVSESMSLIVQRMGRALEIGREAPDYDAAMSGVLGVLRDRAALLSIAVVPGANGRHDLRFNALTSTSSLHSLTSVRSIELALAALPEFSEVRVELPTSFAEGDQASGLPFSVQAVLGAPR